MTQVFWPQMLAACVFQVIESLNVRELECESLAVSITESDQYWLLTAITVALKSQPVTVFQQS